MAEEDEEELLVLELEKSRWLLLRRRARDLIPRGEGERGNLRLPSSLRVRARFDTGVEVDVALQTGMAEFPGETLGLLVGGGVGGR